jgi:hypothetical protein
MIRDYERGLNLSKLEQFISPCLIASGALLSKQCRSAQPLPYVMIDVFFESEAAIDLAERIKTLKNQNYGLSFRRLAQRNLQLGNIWAVVPHIHPVYDKLMNATFTRFIEKVSGYRELQSDRQFAGAGFHPYQRNGFSEIHLDSNSHPFDANLDHRVNLIIFFNPVWQSGWGAELVLWSDQNRRPHRPVVCHGTTIQSRNHLQCNLLGRGTVWSGPDARARSPATRWRFITSVVLGYCLTNDLT